MTSSTGKLSVGVYEVRSAVSFDLHDKRRQIEVMRDQTVERPE